MAALVLFNAVVAGSLASNWTSTKALAADESVAYVVDSGNDTVVPIDTSTNAVGTPIDVDTGADQIVMSPDGSTAYVSGYSGDPDVGFIQPIDTSTDSAGTSFTAPPFIRSMAVTPDGSTLYAVDESEDEVTPFALPSGTSGTAIPLGAGTAPSGIAITPDGSTAYVTESTEPGYVVPIDLTTSTLGTPIAVGNGPGPVVISPDGTTAYVGNLDDDTVTPIDLTTNSAETAIPVSDEPVSLAISPNGDTLYVADSGDSSVQPITLTTPTTGTAGTDISLCGEPAGMAITPDGSSLYVTNPTGNDYGSVTPIGTSTNTAGTCITPGPSGVDLDPVAVAISSSSSLPVLTITASSGSMTYGGTVPTITPDYSGFQNGDTAGSLSTQPTCSTTATATSAVSGSPYTSSCSGAVDSNYTIDYVDGSVTVNPAPTSFNVEVNGSSSATIGSGSSATLSETDLPEGATGTVTFTSGTTLLCTIALPATSCPTSTSLAPGSYTNFSGVFTDTDGNYSSSTSENTLSLTVNPTRSGPIPTSFTITVNGSTSATIASGTADSLATLAESGLPGGASGTVSFTYTDEIVVLGHSVAFPVTLCTITLPATSCTISPRMGRYTDITATFSDTDGIYSGSSSTNSASMTVTAPITNYVTNCQDSGPGSLRYVVTNATWGETVGFHLPRFGTTGYCNSITLTSGEITIATDLTIDGLAADALAVSGDNDSTIFYVHGGFLPVNATISGLSIEKAGTSSNIAGAIDNDEATLTINDCTITENTANGIGGIENEGTLTVTSSTVSDNSASFAGGGIENEGTLTVTNSTVSDNSTSAAGGGIENEGTLTVTDSTVSDNSASAAGGGIENGGILTVTNSTVSNNSGGAGGGIENGGILTVTNSTVSDNSAIDAGGGIVNHGTLTLTDSTVSDNSTSAAGGGINNGDTLTVTDSTVSGNSASAQGGGIENAGGLTLSDSTISDNSAIVAGGGIDNDGGGTTDIDHGTLWGNTGGINNDSGSTTLVATVVGGSGTQPDCSGYSSPLVIDAGYNLDDDGSCGFSAANNSLSDTPADLASSTPEANGGPTPTIALKPGSKGIDHVTSEADCTGAGTDQRGVPWPTPCDIGAIQAGDVDSTTVTFSYPPVVGAPLTVTAKVNPTDGGGTVTFSATLDGAAYPTPTSCLNAALASNEARCTFTPNTAGTYAVTAVYSGDATYGDSLGSASVDIFFSLFRSVSTARFIFPGAA